VCCRGGLPDDLDVAGARARGDPLGSGNAAADDSAIRRLRLPTSQDQSLTIHASHRSAPLRTLHGAGTTVARRSAGQIHGNARRLHVGSLFDASSGKCSGNGVEGPGLGVAAVVLVTATIFGWAGLRTPGTGGPEGPDRLRGGRRDLGDALGLVDTSSAPANLQTS